MIASSVAPFIVSLASTKPSFLAVKFHSCAYLVFVCLFVCSLVCLLLCLFGFSDQAVKTFRNNKKIVTGSTETGKAAGLENAKNS